MSVGGPMRRVWFLIDDKLSEEQKWAHHVETAQRLLIEGIVTRRDWRIIMRSAANALVDIVLAEHGLMRNGRGRK